MEKEIEAEIEIAARLNDTIVPMTVFPIDRCFDLEKPSAGTAPLVFLRGRRPREERRECIIWRSQKGKNVESHGEFHGDRTIIPMTGIELAAMKRSEGGENAQARLPGTSQIANPLRREHANKRQSVSNCYVRARPRNVTNVYDRSLFL